MKSDCESKVGFSILNLLLSFAIYSFAPSRLILNLLLRLQLSSAGYADSESRVTV